MVESEGDAMSINKDFFKLEDKMNKSIRSKDTDFCMSLQSDCLRKCQHQHNHCHIGEHLLHFKPLKNKNSDEA